MGIDRMTRLAWLTCRAKRHIAIYFSIHLQRRHR